MARGFLAGAFWGAVASGVGAGALSLAVGFPQSSPPDAGAVDVPAGSEFNTRRADEAAQLPAGESAPDTPKAPRVSAPAPDDLASMAGADTDPGAAPSPQTSDLMLTDPVAGADSAAVTVETESPVLPNAQTSTLAQPEGESELSISTDPAQPPAPDVPQVESGLGAAAEDPALATEEVAEPAEPQPATEEAAEVMEQEPTPEVQTAEQPEVQTAEQEEPAVQATEAPEPQDVTQAPAPEAPAEEELAVVLPQTDETPAPAKPAVSTGRLPSVGDAEPEPEIAAPSEEVELDTVETDGLEDTRPPLERFAVPFTVAEDKPLMSIILIDDGKGPLSVDALEAFPFPVTFAIDASWSGASEAAKEYRAQGFEVMALANLPEGAKPSDAEVSLAANLSTVPEAVAVMEGDAGGLQGSRPVSDQVREIMLQTGHGVVLRPKGLNTVAALARREGVAATTIFRDFDGEGQDPRVIRRFLDQAAFKSRQEGAVVMLGRLRPDTVSALLLWGLQDRASSVNLVPISTVLRRLDAQ